MPLRQHVGFHAPGSTTLGTYLFDGFMNRFSKTVGTTTVFQYSPNKVLLEESTGGTPTDYIYLNGRPLAMLTGSTFTYLHDDMIGTPKAATNASQTVVWRGNYTPFGPAISTSGTATINLRMPGQYYDAETGLWHNGMRDYSTTLGRYIQSDPIGLAGGVNTYSYASNRPMDLSDPDGTVDGPGNVSSGGFCLFGCVGITITNPGSGNSNYYLQTGGGPSAVGPYFSSLFTDNPDDYASGGSIQGSLSGYDAFGCSLDGTCAGGFQISTPGICYSYGAQLNPSDEEIDQSLNQWGNQEFFSFFGLNYSPTTFRYKESVPPAPTQSEYDQYFPRQNLERFNLYRNMDIGPTTQEIMRM